MCLNLEPTRFLKEADMSNLPIESYWHAVAAKRIPEIVQNPRSAESPTDLHVGLLQRISDASPELLKGAAKKGTANS
jgi:hypothetical protein